MVEQLQVQASGDQDVVKAISEVIGTIDRTTQLSKLLDHLPEFVVRALEEIAVELPDEEPVKKGKAARKTTRKKPAAKKTAGKKRAAKKASGKRAGKKSATKRAAQKTATKKPRRSREPKNASKATAKKAAGKSKMDQDMRDKIASDLAKGEKAKDIAAKYGVTPQSVGNVRRFGR